MLSGITIDTATYILPRSEAKQANKKIYQSANGRVKNHTMYAATGYDTIVNQIATQNVAELRNEGK